MTLKITNDLNLVFVRSIELNSFLILLYYNEA